ncbi:MAG: hypothetical protein HF962_02935 [Sulfurovum sp.]|nr:hypothetical protein [Sulfurovum sp.]
MPNSELLINSIAVPIQIGIYQNSILVKSLEIEGQTSDVLLETLEELLNKYEIKKIIYANGPGSYMAIKLTYIMLRTIEMVRRIDFVGVSAFELNRSKPIKAMGKLYFIKEKETIITQKFDEKVEQVFELPDNLVNVSFDDNNKPQYILPAV